MFWLDLIITGHAPNATWGELFSATRLRGPLSSAHMVGLKDPDGNNLNLLQKLLEIA
jgi:hypothetical protein